jgi:hypothetical protein
MLRQIFSALGSARALGYEAVFLQGSKPPEITISFRARDRPAIMQLVMRLPGKTYYSLASRLKHAFPGF